MPRLLYELPNAPSDANLQGREKHPSVKIRTMPQSHAILSKTKRKGRTDRAVVQTSSIWMPVAQRTWHRAAWCFQAFPSLKSPVAACGDFGGGLTTGALTSPSMAPGDTGTKGFGLKYEDCTS